MLFLRCKGGDEELAINWTQEVEKYRGELIEKTKHLLVIPSVRDDQSAGPGAPFGKDIAAALDFMLALGEKSGFRTKNVDGYAGHVEYGEGEELIGVLSHLDVVPPGDGWSSPPFDPQILDGKLIARGALDDKGAAMASFFALKLIKDLGLPLSKRVRLIFGTDEESEWRDMDYYFSREEMPTMGFTPDADFPLIVAEKGLFDFTLTGKIAETEETDRSLWKLVEFTSGQRANMVPDFAVAKLEGAGDVFELKEKYQEFLLKRSIRGYSEESDEDLTLVLQGISHHGSEPDQGLNAALALAQFLGQIPLDSKGSKYIEMIQSYLVDDFFGEKLGIAMEEQRLGPLTVNAGVFCYRQGVEQSVSLNIRYPLKGKGEEIERKVGQAFLPYGLEVAHMDHKLPHGVEEDHFLVQTLARVYEEQTGDKATLFAIGGATYARTLRTGVAFGPLFPGSPDTAHQKDEFILIEDLLKATAIYAQAIYELAN